MKKNYIHHLYWRVGFGILPNQLKTLSKKSKNAIVDNLISQSKDAKPLKLDTSELDALMTGSIEKTRENIKQIQRISKKKSIELNVAWIERLSNSNALLHEKMTLFWANHFVCKDNNYIYTQKFHNTLRQYALGNFRDFVVAISKEAAMTKYLNTKQNRKQKPNENFARELMELFTLGIGNYSEEDIKESAKAFTGYSHNLQGDFVLRYFQHDNSNKTFFGKTGNFTGEDIINIILEQKQCAHFICQKIYRHFVNDVINERHIENMTNVFYADYDIENLMRYVMLSEWFYDDKNIGTKIKSPVELLAGIKTYVPLHFYDSKQLLYIQKLLGQILLNPPNVAGWKEGKNWIDSNTIVMRLKLPSLLLNNAYISIAEKVSADQAIELKKQAFKNKFGKRFKTETDWAYFNNQFKNVDINDLQNHLLACSISQNTDEYLKSLSKTSKQEYCIQIMSLPEYQMC